MRHGMPKTGNEMVDRQAHWWREYRIRLCLKLNAINNRYGDEDVAYWDAEMKRALVHIARAAK